MTTLEEFIQAASDQNLRERFVAAAQEAGVLNPEIWVDSNRGELTRARVSDAGDATATIVSVYAYAWNVYKQTLPKPPGANPGAVTDDHIRYALRQVLEPPMEEVPSEPTTGS